YATAPESIRPSLAIFAKLVNFDGYRFRQSLDNKLGYAVAFADFVCPYWVFNAMVQVHLAVRPIIPRLPQFFITVRIIVIDNNANLSFISVINRPYLYA